MRKALFRTTACAVVSAASLVAGGILPAHAAAGVAFTDAAGDVLDPFLTQNELVAVPTTTRPYADIVNTTVTPNGSNDVAFTINTVGAIPTFPQTNGDTGIQLNACFDVPGNEAIANGPVQVGVGHHGAPVFDGPYNSRYGWKICAWYSEQAGGLSNIVDYGVSTFDPIGQYTFFDKAQLGNIIAPSKSGSSVTFHFPYTWVVNIQPPSPPEIGIARTESHQFLAAGDAINNIVVSSQVFAGVTLPVTLCEPVECNILGPIAGVGGLLFTVDWTPGRQVCSTAVVSCINDDGGSGKGNGFTLGLLPIGFPLGALQDCDAANLNASCPVVGPATVNYDECFAGPGTNTTQDTGDLYAVSSAAGLQGTVCSSPKVIPWPYEYHTVNGRTLIPDTPQYTPDTASATA